MSSQMRLVHILHQSQTLDLLFPLSNECELNLFIGFIVKTSFLIIYIHGLC